MEGTKSLVTEQFQSKNNYSLVDAVHGVVNLFKEKADEIEKKAEKQKQEFKSGVYTEQYIRDRVQEIEEDSEAELSREREIFLRSVRMLFDQAEQYVTLMGQDIDSRVIRDTKEILQANPEPDFYELAILEDMAANSFYALKLIYGRITQSASFPEEEVLRRLDSYGKDFEQLHLGQYIQLFREFSSGISEFINNYSGVKSFASPTNKNPGDTAMPALLQLRYSDAFFEEYREKINMCPKLLLDSQLLSERLSEIERLQLRNILGVAPSDAKLAQVIIQYEWMIPMIMRSQYADRAKPYVKEQLIKSVAKHKSEVKTLETENAAKAKEVNTLAEKVLSK